MWAGVHVTRACSESAHGSFAPYVYVQHQHMSRGTTHPPHTTPTPRPPLPLLLPYSSRALRVALWSYRAIVYERPFPPYTFFTIKVTTPLTPEQLAEVPPPPESKDIWAYFDAATNTGLLKYDPELVHVAVEYFNSINGLIDVEAGVDDVEAGMRRRRLSEDAAAEAVEAGVDEIEPPVEEVKPIVKPMRVLNASDLEVDDHLVIHTLNPLTYAPPHHATYCAYSAKHWHIVGVR